MKCIGSKRITFVSLALGTGACFILSQAKKSGESEDSIVITGNEALTAAIKTVLSFTDTAILGYLLICIAIAFLTMASIEEVLSGTENKLLSSKFHEASNLHLFVESTFLVHAVV